MRQYFLRPISLRLYQDYQYQRYPYRLPYADLHLDFFEYQRSYLETLQQKQNQNVPLFRSILFRPYSYLFALIPANNHDDNGAGCDVEDYGAEGDDVAVDVAEGVGLLYRTL